MGDLPRGLAKREPVACRVAAPRPAWPAWPALPARPAGVHALGGDGAFAAHECVCRLGPQSPAARGEYGQAKVAVLVAGAFHARSSLGEALLGPGAMLLGNAGEAYEYRHVDAGGDRSVVFEYAEATIEEVERSVGGRTRGGRAFERACVPASAGSAAAATLALEALRGGEAEALREAGLAALGAALAARAGGDGAPARPSAWQERRVAQVMRHVEARVDGDCSLDVLAAQAGLSAFHFLRAFRALTGQTPRQFVIATRLRAAASALATTDAPVTAIAAACGFGDLSNFHASFARAFGASPRAHRRRRAR